MSCSSSSVPSPSMIRQYIQLFAGFVARSIFDQQWVIRKVEHEERARLCLNPSRQSGEGAAVPLFRLQKLVLILNVLFSWASAVISSK